MVNLDCPWGKRLCGELTVDRRDVNVLTFSLWGTAAIQPRDATFERSGVRADLATPYGNLAVELPLSGHYNLANLMTVVGMALGLGLAPEQIGPAIPSFSGVPGRLERLDGKQDISVFIDYAHTPDALANVLDALKPFRRNRIVAVFGCGGERDRPKRPEMAREAADRADVVIVTSDNPRNEDPEAILDGIMAGLPQGKACERIADRREAIYRAIRSAAPGDLVLIAGKGHEPYQEIKGRRYPFNDRDVALEAMRDAGLLDP